MELLANVTFTELKYILAVEKEMHFGRAAANCFVSQPTLSIAIKKLEDSLGVTIFERSKTTLIITEIGHQILDKARVIVEQISEIKVIAKESKNPFSTPVKVGAIHTIGPYLFPELINQLNNTNSPINIIIEEGYTDNLHQKLLSGELDVIIVASPFNHQGITTTTLYTEALEIIIPNNHKWSDRFQIKPEELYNETLLLLGKGNCFRDEVLQICPKCIDNDKDNKSKMIITTSLETIKYMVARGLGVSIMPNSAIKNDNSNLYLTKKFEKIAPKREVVIAYRSSYFRTTLIQNLIQSIQKISQS